MNTEVRRQEKLDLAEEKDFRRGKLPEKYSYMNRMIGNLKMSIEEGQREIGESGRKKTKQEREMNQQAPPEVGTLKKG